MTTYSELIRIRERLTSPSAPSPAELAEMAAVLPSAIDGERPETALVLAELYGRLWPQLGEARWPDWRSADLPVRVRIAWLRAEILREPAVIRGERRGELLYQALRQVCVTDARRPDRLVAEIAEIAEAAESADEADAVLQGEVLRLVREGLQAACLSPGLVTKYVVSLLASDADEVVAAALDQLAEPWAALSPLPAGTFSGFLTADAVPIADAALSAASNHGHGDTLRSAVEDPDVSPRLRQRALEHLGDLADRHHIPDLIGTAERDPLLLGAPLLACLRGLHRRGRFLDDADVPALLGIALADHTIPAQQVATILFVNRHSAFARLMDAAPDDPNWPRRLDLLVALDRQEPGEIAAGDAITRMLPLVHRPGPFLTALRTLRHRDAEEAVIALLPSAYATQAALSALEAIGGRRTVAALRAGLGLGGPGLGSPGLGSPGLDSLGFDSRGFDSRGTDSRGRGESKVPEPIAPYLVPHRNQALEILWHLTRDLTDRHALLERLDPADLPPRIAADLGGSDEREMVLLRSHLDPGKPVAALCRLAASGGAGTVPVIADLLLRIVAELAAWWEPGAPDWRLDSEPQTGEPVVPQEVVDALRDLSRKLHARKKIRPACLLDAATPQAAGNALVASVALDLLDRPGVSAPEQAILLELLGRVPSAQTRPRVHRLLRHPDRHVRKHVIELFARDASEDDAQALSATLIRLTAAGDAPTVRQTLLALGRARARWAAAAIAGCLDHPTMNVKKTAAEVLAEAGSPAAVPKALFWLRHHDNPGFRADLVAALRAILGSAYAATLVAAAEVEQEGRTRHLLLSALDQEMTESSLLALAEQQSPAVPTLLALVASGEISLLSGSLDGLATAFAEHSVPAPAPTPPRPSAPADEAVRALLAVKWDPSIALRIAELPVPPQAGLLRELRPRLTDWLRLAGSESTVRTRLPQLFPAPWTPADLAALTSCTPVLLDGLTAADDENRAWFLHALSAVAPELTAVEKLAVVDVVRALRPPASSSTTGSPTLGLLRACDAVLVRRDVNRALGEAALSPDPTDAQAAVLRDVFTSMRTASPASPDEADAAEAWRADLAVAVRTRTALEAFRTRSDGVTDSQNRLEALIEVFASSGTEVRPALLDWMLALQPWDVPSWTMAEPGPEQEPRTPSPADLDQPRSAAQRERLVAMLASPDRERRDAAAWMLQKWHEPDVRRTVLGPYLRDEIGSASGGPLADVTRTLGLADLRTEGVLPERVLFAAGMPAPGDTDLLIPLALEWWEQGLAALRESSTNYLRGADPDLLAEALSSRWEAGQWGFAQLLAGRKLLRTPALTALCERLREDGRATLADSITLVDGPLRGPGARQDDAAALARLRDASQVPKPSAPPSRSELVALARTGSPEQIRRALLRLVETEDGEKADSEVQDLLAELLAHPKPKIRLLAHRTARQLLDRPDYLRATEVLLADAQPDVVRTAVRTLSHAGWEPAVPALVALLEHPQAAVRAEASEGLVRMGGVAMGALRRAADHARPDRRGGYIGVLSLIETAEGGSEVSATSAGRP